MVITYKPVEGLHRVYSQNKIEPSSRVKASSSFRGSEVDKVDLSDQAKGLQVALQALKNVPEIRTDKVEALKEAIQKGKYQVSSSQIAEAILREIE